MSQPAQDHTTIKTIKWQRPSEHSTHTTLLSSEVIQLLSFVSHWKVWAPFLGGPTSKTQKHFMTTSNPGDDSVYGPFAPETRYPGSTSAEMLKVWISRGSLTVQCHLTGKNRIVFNQNIIYPQKILVQSPINLNEQLNWAVFKNPFLKVFLCHFCKKGEVIKQRLWQ